MILTIPGLPPEWTILLAFAACVGTLLLGWLKSRALDVRVALLEEAVRYLVPKTEFERLCSAITKLEACERSHDRDLVHLEELMRFCEFARDRLDAVETLKSEILEKFTSRGDFIREIQTMTSQLIHIHSKLDQVDSNINYWKGRVHNEHP